MTPERWAQIEDLFHRAVECGPEDRTAVLDQACCDDPQLRREVEALLSSDGSAADAMQAALRSQFEGFGFPLTGEVVSHYRILDGVGVGGMGIVYRAEDIKLGRLVAIKFLPEESANNPVALSRFEREARSASALQHPNICPIHEFGEHEGKPFLVMQLLEGQTLRELLENRRSENSKPGYGAVAQRNMTLPLEQVLDLAIQIADGLQAAHQKGVIHRDIKPANMFITNEGHLKILDFGLAKLAQDVAISDDLALNVEGSGERARVDPVLSRTGVAVGTAAYMSPEQVRGEKLDARTDLFSFGLVLYEMATGKTPFEGSTSGEICGAILHQEPPPPSQLNPQILPQLEMIIRKALEKDRNLRYQHASEMRSDLQRSRRDSESRGSATVIESKPVSRRTHLQGLAVGAIVVTAAIVATFLWNSKRPAVPRSRRTIAVLPLKNLNGDVSVGFLRFALADEVSNALMATRTLDVRPSSMTRKYTAADVDARQVASDVRVATVVTGHFLKQGDNLLVTLEAIDGASDKLLWQTTLTAPAEDLIKLQSMLTAQVDQGLMAAIGMPAGQRGTRPHDPVAYNLYLHSLALPHDPGSNKDAIAVLEHVVQSDSNYAPAWEELGMRYYWDYSYSDGGEQTFQRATNAFQRALTLDPNRVVAAGQLITNRVERGELGKAYQEAQALVERRPDAAEAHFVMSYVYRYAGMLPQASEECDKALSLDPGNFTFRSCAWVFMEMGNTKRAFDFINLDAKSEWAAYVMPSLLLREGEIEKAREAVTKMPTAPRYHRDLLEACLGLRPAEYADQLAHEAETTPPAAPDAELLYYQGALFADCGKRQASLHLLQGAIEQNYCAYSNLELDPMLRKVRLTPGFDKLLVAARVCQDNIRTASNSEVAGP